MKLFIGVARCDDFPPFCPAPPHLPERLPYFEIKKISANKEEYPSLDCVWSLDFRFQNRNSGNSGEICRVSILCKDAQARTTFNFIWKTRMHSSRMRTVRSLTTRVHLPRVTHATENITLPQLRCGR